MQLPYEVLQKIVCEKLIEEDEDRLSLIKKRMNEAWENQKIISIGGKFTKTDVIKVWNFHEWTSFYIPDLPFFRYCHCSLKLDNFVYCIGGCKEDENDVTNEVWIFNLNENALEWKQLKSMNSKRERFSAAVFDNVLVVCGGWDGNKQLASCEAYLLQSNQWKMLPSMKQKRIGNRLIHVGYLYAIGGYGSGKYLSSVERMHGLDSSWKKFPASLKTPRSDFACVTYNNMIYVMGGRSADNQRLKSVEMFDTSSSCWIVCESMNRVRSCVDACVLQNKIFVVGGVDESGSCVNEIECFDASDKSWKVVGNTDEDLYYHTLIVLSE